MLLGQYTVNVVQDDRKWERRVSVNPCKQGLSRAGEVGGLRGKLLDLRRIAGGFRKLERLQVVMS